MYEIRTFIDANESCVVGRQPVDANGAPAGPMEYHAVGAFTYTAPNGAQHTRQRKFPIAASTLADAFAQLPAAMDQAKSDDRRDFEREIREHNQRIMIAKPGNPKTPMARAVAAGIGR